MDARTYLRQVETLDVRIRNKLIEQQQWREIALGITGNTEGERVQSSGAKNKIENAVIKLVDMEAEINSLVDNLIDTKKEVIQTIERLYSPIEYDVLHKRFIQYKTLQQIADDYKKDYDWAKSTCKRAVRHVQALLDGGSDEKT